MLTKPSGIKFPFTFGASGGVRRVGGVEKAKTNLEAIVKTAINERLINKNTGTVGYQAVLRNADKAQFNLIRDLIREAITRHEPRVVLLNVLVYAEENDDGNHVVVAVEFIFRQTGETATLVAKIV